MADQRGLADAGAAGEDEEVGFVNDDLLSLPFMGRDSAPQARRVGNSRSGSEFAAGLPTLTALRSVPPHKGEGKGHFGGQPLKLPTLTAVKVAKFNLRRGFIEAAPWPV